MKDNRFEFIKGLAVTFVILLHTISDKGLQLIEHYFHIGQAVPLFILVTFIVSFMSLEKREGCECGYWYSKDRFWTMIKRIFVPYYVMQVALWTIQSLWHQEIQAFGISGQGPGSYYPWVYLQFWLTMPLIFLIIRKPKGFVLGGVILLIINEIIQVGCSYVNLPEPIYRQFAGRYLFLAFFANLFMVNQIKLKTIIVSLIIGTIYLVSVGHVNYEPWLYNSWMSQQLPAFFYTYVFFHILLYIYERIKESVIARYFVKLGNNSWYVFLSQMFFITLININKLSFLPGIAKTISYILLISLLSIAPVLLFSKLKGKMY